MLLLSVVIFMANIQRDLLKILKNKSKDEVLLVVQAMYNGKYKYEKEYLNNVPYNEMMVYLKNIVELSAKKSASKKELEELEMLMLAINNIDKLEYSDLDKFSLINIKSSANLFFCKFKNTMGIVAPDKKTKAILLAVLILGVLYINDYKQELKNNEDLDNYDDMTESTNEMDNAVSYDQEIIDNSLVTDDESDVVLEDEVENVFEQICCLYNLTPEELDVVCAIAMAEAKTASYEDAYAVINTIYNRTISNRWVCYINKLHKNEVGESLYYQAITNGQFVVYENGRYKQFLGVREGDGYQAVIDFLLTKDLIHDYLSFRSSNTNVKTFEQFVEGGNKYFDVLLEEDRIITQGRSR